MSKNLFSNINKNITSNKIKLKKLKPEVINVKIATVISKKNELLLLDNYKLTGALQKINLTYDFENINQYLLTTIHPVGIIETTDAFGNSMNNKILTENTSFSYVSPASFIYHYYYWENLNDSGKYRINIQFQGAIWNEIADSYVVAPAYLTYKLSIRNKKVWSKIEKFLK